jgi:hypothetical protein
LNVRYVFNRITLEKEPKDSLVLSVGVRTRYLAGIVAYTDGPIEKLRVGRLELQGNFHSPVPDSEFVTLA